MKKIFDLENEIKSILEKRTEDIFLKKYNESEKSKIRIIVGQLPVEKFEEIIPCISVKAFSGRNTLEEKRFKLRIAIAIFNENSEEGYKELYEIIETISQEIIEKGILLNSFEILPEYEWNLLDEQPYPYWAGEIIFNILQGKDYRKDVDNWINGEEWEN